MSDSGTGAQPPVSPGAGPQPAGPSVCPRHPDREAYVKCQRCGRPACPECQRPAAVGIQCVDCVREAARTAPTARTIFGGRATDGRPLVTQGIIGVCVALFVLQWASPAVTDDFAFQPVLGWTEPWRFLSAMFLHAPRSLWHIGFNMYALFILGSYLEPMLGRARFAVLYLISGIGGQVAVLLLATNPTLDAPLTSAHDSWFQPVVGASGAIFGLFGALIVLNRHLGRSAAGIYGVLIINGVLGFVIPNISWQAHLGGFLAGLACAGAIVLFRRQQVRHLTWVALGAVLVLLVAITIGKYLTVPVEIRDLTAFGR